MFTNSTSTSKNTTPINTFNPPHLIHHVWGSFNALKLLLLGSLLSLLFHLLIKLLEELALGALLKICDFLKLDPVLAAQTERKQNSMSSLAFSATVSAQQVLHFTSSVT